MANQNSLNNLSYGFTLPSLNLNFTSTAQRITGDMSNATHNNRLAFQSSTVNGASSLFVLPNGTGTSSSAVCSNASDPTNSAFVQMQIDATSVKFISSVLGTGTQLPMEIRIGSTAAIDISTAGAVSILNTSAGNTPLTITGTTAGGLIVNQAISAAANISLFQSSATAEPPYVNFFKNRSGGNINAADGLGNIRFFGFATANQVAAQITCIAESIGAARVSGGLNFWTTNTAGSTGQRLVLVADGGLSINTPSTAISALTVNGTNTAGTYAQQTLATIAGGLFNANRCLNLSATAGSGCQIQVGVTGQIAATGGDPTLAFTNTVGATVQVGIDTSLNKVSMSTGTLGDANNFFAYDIATSQLNLPRQCSFNVEVGVNLPNVTGAGAAYTVPFGSTRYNIGGGFAGNIFVAPVAGKYLFSGSLRISGITALMTYMQIIIPNAGGNYLFGICNPAMIAAIAGAPNTLCVPFSIIMSMNAGEFTFVQLIIIGGAGNTAGVDASTSFWSGQLLS